MKKLPTGKQALAYLAARRQHLDSNPSRPLKPRRHRLASNPPGSQVAAFIGSRDTDPIIPPKRPQHEYLNTPRKKTLARLMRQPRALKIQERAMHSGFTKRMNEADEVRLNFVAQLDRAIAFMDRISRSQEHLRADLNGLVESFRHHQAVRDLPVRKKKKTI